MGCGNVFFKKEFIYGEDSRCNAGYGLWQLAFGSTGEMDMPTAKGANSAVVTDTPPTEEAPKSPNEADATAATDETATSSTEVPADKK